MFLLWTASEPRCQLDIMPNIGLAHEDIGEDILLQSCAKLRSVINKEGTP